MSFVLSVLGLFDNTLSTMQGVPIFAFLLSFFVFAMAVSLFFMLKDAAKGRSARRK